MGCSRSPSVRRHQKVSQCWTEGDPDDPRVGQLLTKAKPGLTSVITYLRSGKKGCTRASERGEGENVLQTSRSVKGEQEEVLLVPEQSTAQLCPCSLWRSMVKQRSTCSRWRNPCWSPEGVWSLQNIGVYSRCGSAGVTLWCWTRHSWLAAPHGENPHWRNSWRTTSCGKDPLSSGWKERRRKAEPRKKGRRRVLSFIPISHYINLL